jgi:tripartite-type tricarboxylate transporter receptor subunit TctC
LETTTVHPITRRRLLAGAAFTAFSSGIARHALAQPAPFDMVRLMVGFPPGGTSDVVGRRLADQLKNGYAKTVVVENKPGAAGRTALEQFAQAPADGSQVFVTPTSALTVYPALFPKLGYRPLEDLSPVATACTFESALAIGPAVPESVKSVRDFIAWCKANPSQANYGSPGAGGVSHFMGELFGRHAGIELRHVAYRGSQPAVLDLLGGHVPAVFAPLGEFLPQMKTGKLRLLATSGPERSKFAPDVPTFIAQGLRELEVRDSFTVLLPGKAPAAAMQRLSEAVRAATQAPAYVEGLGVMALEARHVGPTDLDRALRADMKRWAAAVKLTGITAD